MHKKNITVSLSTPTLCYDTRSFLSSSSYFFFFCPSISPTFTQMANVLTGQFVGFQPAFGVESADHKIICEPAGTGAEAGGHFETGPVVPLSLKQGAY